MALQIKHEAAQSAVYERQEAKYVCVKMDQTGKLGATVLGVLLPLQCWKLPKLILLVRCSLGGGQTHKPGLMTAVASQRCAACAASNVRVTGTSHTRALAAECVHCRYRPAVSTRCASSRILGLGL